MSTSRVLSILLLGPALASASEPTFREAASLALVEIGLRDVPDAAYACVSIDDRRPSDRQLATFRALGLRDAEHASAELLVLCGWPKGAGQFADFEKRDGHWRYVGARTYIKL